MTPLMPIRALIALLALMLGFGLIGGLVVSVLATPQAHAQNYPPPPPPPDDEDDGDERDQGEEGAGGPGAGGGPSAGAGDGELPFTGYPMTPLLLLMLAMIAAGLLLRSYLAVRDRLRTRAGFNGPTA